MFTRPDQLQRPTFTANVQSAGCAFKITLNGVEIHSETDDGELKVAIPVNQWVVAGPNTLTLHAASPGTGRDPIDELAQIQVVLAVREHGTPRELDIPVTGLAFDGSLARSNRGFEPSRAYPGLEVVTTPRTPTTVGYTATRAAECVHGFPDWAWWTAPAFANDPATRQRLIEAYSRLHAALSRFDVLTVRDIVSLKARELSQAYYEDSVETGYELTDYFSMLKNSELKLAALDVDRAKVHLNGNGKLARLEDSSGDSILRFEFKDAPLAWYMKAVYCQDATGSLLHVR
jgi:hypothetical protein